MISGSRRILVCCGTCEYHDYGSSGCKIGWCINYKDYKSIIPMTEPRKYYSKNGKLCLTEEFVMESEFSI